MRKNEIRPGVVYAYKRGKYSAPEPVVFLRPPADGVLYESSSHRLECLPYFARSERTKPESAMFYTRGYPIARIDSVLSPVDLDPRELLKLTLADFEESRRAWDTGIDVARFEVITSLAWIVGEYDAVMAERTDA